MCVCPAAAPGSRLPAVGNAIHAISIHDVASDTVHQFAPTYRDYVLYSDNQDEDGGKDGSGDEKPKKTFRAKTFVPVGAVRLASFCFESMAFTLSWTGRQVTNCGFVNETAGLPLSWI